MTNGYSPIFTSGDRKSACSCQRRFEWLNVYILLFIINTRFVHKVYLKEITTTSALFKRTQKIREETGFLTLGEKTTTTHKCPQLSSYTVDDVTLVTSSPRSL